MPASPGRFVRHGASGNDRFGVLVARFARCSGTPRLILVQTRLVVVWTAVEAIAISLSRGKPHPSVPLTPAFSTQAADAAPLIRPAQTRQAERDKQIAELTTELQLHAAICRPG